MLTDKSGVNINLKVLKKPNELFTNKLKSLSWFVLHVWESMQGSGQGQLSELAYLYVCLIVLFHFKNHSVKVFE